MGTRHGNVEKKGQVVPEQEGIRSSDALGRVYTVHPTNSECFHLRLLLHEVRGPMSFKDLRTFDGWVCEHTNRLANLEDFWRMMNIGTKH
ncbi:hypothetical protein AVEN_36883-1 [Araneus ventricosus]|uniref:Uncharacterized protein n=1 Tax=Araneus ventricosus TaxID=182803 RepID=A0A4Y2RBE1_ARAVE|nr:hypothetical protein AVEN_36883-1 [Araneus ventricosus]